MLVLQIYMAGRRRGWASGRQALCGKGANVLAPDGQRCEAGGTIPFSSAISSTVAFMLAFPERQHSQVGRSCRSFESTSSFCQPLRFLAMCAESPFDAVPSLFCCTFSITTNTKVDASGHSPRSHPAA